MSKTNHAAALSVGDVSPVLARYLRDTIMGDVWNRPDLSKRDRSIITLAALIARTQTVELSYYLQLALQNDVTAGEISEVITHLAFYAGWGNASAAVVVAKEIFFQHSIGSEQLPPASPSLLTLDEATEALRAGSVSQNIGAVAPGIVKYTTDVLFRDLWLRPGLAPRDRSLVTVSALISQGQVAQIPFHLNRAMDNGLTHVQVSEVITHLAFYAGWPNSMSAVPIIKEVFAARSAPNPT